MYTQDEGYKVFLEELKAEILAKLVGLLLGATLATKAQTAGTGNGTYNFGELSPGADGNGYYSIGDKFMVGTGSYEKSPGINRLPQVA